MARIHAVHSDGTLLSGVPAFLAVWDRLPYWRALSPLLHAAPGAIPVAEVAYSAFARVRLRVTGRGVGGGSACAPGEKSGSR
jgi:predicted DCC family thiol-disulfide oxidoreductase YuxK